MKRKTVLADGAHPDDTSIIWHDGKLLALEGKGWANTESYYDRLPGKAKADVTPAVWELSLDSAGMSVCFSTDSSTVNVKWTLLKDKLAKPHMPATGISGLDLYAREKSGKWAFQGNGRPEGISNNASFKVEPGSECLLYLPLYNGVKSLEIGVPKGKALSTPDLSPVKRGKPIVFYGTSITQGACASRPGMAATSIVGRELDVPVINLGFSGSGKMEPALAELLAELDPSIYVLDSLHNMPADERVEPFVKTLRETHPSTPILLVEDSNFKGISPTDKGRKLRVICEKLENEGMKDLYFIPNTDMLGSDGEGTVDGVHPNDLGMMRQAMVFVKRLSPLLPSTTKPKII